MLPDRQELDRVADDALAGQEISISLQSEARSYRLIRVAGRGQTGVAWEVKDSRGRPFAVKFVLKADYGTHSLDAETSRTDSLASSLFAKIEFFGEPKFLTAVLDCTAFYAIVVDWIAGQPLTKFLDSGDTTISPDVFLRLSRDLCEILQALKDVGLSHSDLHGGNILVKTKTDPLAAVTSYELVVIDTGQLKTSTRRAELLEIWQQQLETIESLLPSTDQKLVDADSELRRRLAYFERTDQEWVVFHFCAIFNAMERSLSSLDVRGKRFVKGLPALLRCMVDPDPSRRMADPKRMHSELESLWQSCLQQQQQAGMTSPFDLPSAELIRSDRQLMALFSDEYPRLEACRSAEPIYLYGPRGCGKSTILRSLSLKAILASDQPTDELAKIPFVGVYVSASQELRSRFWLMDESDFDVLEAHLVRFFVLLLVESLIDTLDAAYKYECTHSPGLFSDLTENATRQCAGCVRSRLQLAHESLPYADQSYLSVLLDDIRRERDQLWLAILDRQTPRSRSNAQLVFDICQDLESHWPFLKGHRVAFLIDDYSNQRIPVGLQRRLNQAITFAKQGSPIFKVTSEYEGVDLEGVQEGREVHEVNVGSEYISLQDADRYRFLRNVLERRFAYLGSPVQLTDVLPLSGVEPATQLARAIRLAVDGRKRFYYHGLDTISDVCSGVFAMGIDVVRRIFDQAGLDWRSPVTVSPKTQDRVIREYAKHEFEHIRFHSRSGRLKHQIADRLCWFAHQCLTKQEQPIVKNHIDISDTALRQLEELYPDKAKILAELVSRGILFPLHTSRTRRGRDATFRVMMRRILLTVHTAALGRDQPIRIDDVQRLQFLLTEPKDFVEDELRRMQSDAEAKPPQQTFDFGEDDNAGNS